MILSDENDQNNTKLETILNKIQNIKTLLNETNTQPQGVVDGSTFNNLFTTKNIMPVVVTIVFYGILYYFWHEGLYYEMSLQLQDYINGQHKQIMHAVRGIDQPLSAFRMQFRPHWWLKVPKIDVASGPDLPSL